jgi:hypothetical protein
LCDAFKRFVVYYYRVTEDGMESYVFQEDR